MTGHQTALLVIDVQESFRHRPYWSDRQLPRFVDRLQALIAGARELGVPIVRVLHVEDSGAFSLASGLVTPLAPVTFDHDVEFLKRSHSALVGTGLDVWLTQRGVRRLIVAGIRTEQCCETTTRHASDQGYDVDFVTEATLTFPILGRDGKLWSPEEIAERTELVLDERFARVTTVEGALRKVEELRAAVRTPEVAVA
jgi:nicotinamidase-related amidase